MFDSSYFYFNVIFSISSSILYEKIKTKFMKKVKAFIDVLVVQYFKEAARYCDFV